MKEPRPRSSRQSKAARKVLDDENLGSLLIRLDKSLRKQFFLSTDFQDISMNKAVNEFIKGYVKKHYPEAMKGVANLEEQAERREK